MVAGGSVRLPPSSQSAPPCRGRIDPGGIPPGGCAGSQRAQTAAAARQAAAPPMKGSGSAIP